MTKSVVREDLQRVVSDDRIAELDRDVKSLIAKVANLEGRFEEKRKNEERSFNRKWQIVSVILTVILAGAVTAILYLAGIRA